MMRVVATADLKGTTVNLTSCGILIILGPGIPQGSCSISVFLENEAAMAFATSNISCLQMPSKLYIPAQMNIRIKYPFFSAPFPDTIFLPQIFSSY